MRYLEIVIKSQYLYATDMIGKDGLSNQQKSSEESAHDVSGPKNYSETQT